MKRALGLIEADLGAARTAAETTKGAYKRAKARVAELDAERRATDEYRAAADAKLRAGLGDYLYQEWVVRCGLTCLSMLGDEETIREYGIHHTQTVWVAAFNRAPRSVWSNEGNGLGHIAGNTAAASVEALWAEALAANARQPRDLVKPMAMLAVLEWVYDYHEDALDAMENIAEHLHAYLLQELARRAAQRQARVGPQ